MKTVQEVMKKNIIRVDKSKTILAVSRIMSEKSISCVVITEKNLPVGIVTERDMIKKVLAEKLASSSKIDKIMTSPLQFVTPDTSFEAALNTMTANKIRRLLVKEGKTVLGLITQTDVLRETKNVETKNNLFTKYQNIQSYVIIGIIAAVMLFLLVSFIKTKFF